MGLTVFFYLLMSCSTLHAAINDNVTVLTTNGPVVGVEKVTANNTRFWNFLGIPFAAPPVNELRFRDPSKTQALLPVIVWIHGGGFVVGTGNTKIQKTEGFLDNGVIYVSINYRLGIFGFLSTEDEASPGNYGLKDQITALNWIQANIKAFGGDPDQVTIFGESAGAVSVYYLIQSNLTDGLFSGAIADSGTTLCPWSAAQNPNQTARRIGKNAFGPLVNLMNSTILVESLRLICQNRLQKISSGLELYNNGSWNGLPWAPSIEPISDEAVVTSKSYGILNSGTFTAVPLLTGFNSNEAKNLSYLLGIPAMDIITTDFYKHPAWLTPKDMNAADPSVPGKLIRKYYLDNIVRNPVAKFEKYLSDNLFVRPIHKTVQFYSNSSSVYFYEFAFSGGAAPSSNSTGVAHAEELQFLFNYPQKTAPAILTQQRMLKMWTNFVKYGNPTPTPDPLLQNITWPIASLGDPNVSYLLINDSLSVRQNPQQADMIFWDKLYTKYSQPNTIYNTY